MSYLKNNNNKITVDAVLTKAGQAKLATQGTLGIKFFAVGDNDIDYALYNSSHPMGSDYYNSSIINMPVLEPSVRDDIQLKTLFTGASDVVNVIALIINSDVPTTGIKNYNIYKINPTLDGYDGDITDISYSAKITKPAHLEGLTYTFKAIGGTGGTGTSGVGTGASSGNLQEGASTPTQQVIGKQFEFRVVTPPYSQVTLTVTVNAIGASVNASTLSILVLENTEFTQQNTKQNQIEYPNYTQI